MCFGICPKCLRLPVRLTKHHILPRRFFSQPRYSTNDNAPIMWLCRKCHDRADALLPQAVKLTKQEYFEIAYMFLGGNYD